MKEILIKKTPKRKPAKWARLADKDCVAHCRNLYLVEGLSCPQIYEKVRPMVANPFSVDALINIASAEGWRKLKAPIFKERKRIKSEVFFTAKKTVLREERARANAYKSEIRPQIAAEVIEELKERQRKGARKHFDRMEKKLDRAAELINEDSMTEKNVGFKLSQLSQLDFMARRLYNMDAKEQVTGNQFNVALLIGGQEFVRRRDDSAAQEVTQLTEDDLLNG